MSTLCGSGFAPSLDVTADFLNDVVAVFLLAAEAPPPPDTIGGGSFNGGNPTIPIVMWVELMLNVE